METDDYDQDEINISVLDIVILHPEHKNRINEDAMQDNLYQAICKPLNMGEEGDDNYAMINGLLCLRN